MARAAKSPDTVFNGFDKKAFTFFKGLEFYQNKQWFTENKPVYEKEVLRPLGNLVNELAVEMDNIGLPLTGDPQRSIFRIHRDVRFSKDKTPYKTHASAVLSRDGRKMSPGMLYIHIASERSFAAIGTYHPDPDSLAAIRDAIAASPERWLKIHRDMDKNGFELYREDMLKRLPRGYEAFADSPIAESLKLRSFITSYTLPAASLGNKKLVDEIVGFVGKGRKFLEFNWSAIDHARAKKE